MFALPECICKRHAYATDSCSVSTLVLTRKRTAVMHQGSRATIEISISIRVLKAVTAVRYLGTRLSICTWIDRKRKHWKEKQTTKHPSQGCRPGTAAQTKPELCRPCCSPTSQRNAQFRTAIESSSSFIRTFTIYWGVFFNKEATLQPLISFVKWVCVS